LNRSWKNPGTDPMPEKKLYSEFRNYPKTKKIPGIFRIITLFSWMGIQSFSSGTLLVLMKNLNEKNKYLSEKKMKECITLAGLIPGPYHINLVLGLGFQMAGFRGLISALLGFTLPSFLLAVLTVQVISHESVILFLEAYPGIIRGMTASIAGLLGAAIFKFSKNIIVSQYSWILTFFLFLLLYMFQPPFILIIFATGILFAVLQGRFSFMKLFLSDIKQLTPEKQ